MSMEQTVEHEKHGRVIKIERYPVTFTAMIHDKIEVLAGPTHYRNALSS